MLRLSLALVAALLALGCPARPAAVDASAPAPVAEVAPAAPPTSPEEIRPFCLREGVTCACAADLEALVRWAELQPKDPPKPPLRRVEGEVVFGHHRPVAGAKVFLLSDGGGVQLLLTDAQGLFRAEVSDAPFFAVVAAPQRLPVVRRLEQKGHLGPTFELALPSAAEGVVLERGAPAAGARVRLSERSCSKSEQVVDLGGRFRFEGLVPGYWELIAARGGQRRVKSISVGGDPRQERIDLTATGVLQGKVFAPSGTAAVGAQVRALELDAGTTVDAEGDFQLELPVGQQQLEVTLAGWHPYPLRADVSERDNQTPYISLQRPVTMTGVVEGPDGPLGGAALHLVDHRSRYHPADRRDLGVRTGPDGSFTVALPPGRWNARVEATFGNLEPGAMSPEAPSPVRIRLQPPTRLLGRVVDAEGAPGSGALLELFEEKETKPSDTATADDTGAFALWPRGKGPWTVKATLRRYSPVQRTVLTGSLALAAGAPRGDLGAVTVKPAELAVEGVVVDEQGHPLSGALVALDPAVSPQAPVGLDARGQWRTIAMHGPGVPYFSGAEHMVRSAADGTFRLAGLTAGPYYAVADHPEFGLDRKKAIKVKAGQKGLRLVLGKKPRLVGKVVGAKGTLPRILLQGVELPQNENGFELVLEQSGPVDVTFEARGHARAVKRYVLKPGQALDVGVVILAVATGG